MTYNVQWQSTRDGAPVEAITIPGKSNVSLPNNTIDNSTSLTLTGKGLSNYGEIQQENFIRLLENFSSSNAPQNPTVGQLWFDTVQNSLKLYAIDQQWIPVGSLAVDITPPSAPIAGSLWWHTTEKVLYLNVGTGAPNEDTARYYPDGTGEWTQVWPSPDVAGAITEYNSIADRMNRILGAPSSFGSNPDVAENKWGWGQTDLLPIFSNFNTAAYPGGPAIARPFNNNAWTILLSRLRKAAFHITNADQNLIPLTGFIKDGRGNNAEMLQHSTSSQFPFTYGPDWNGSGMITKLSEWQTTQQLMDALEANRFAAAPTSLEFSSISTTQRLTSWQTTVKHTISVTFATAAAADIFFNSGGYLRFDAILAPSGSDALSLSWQNFLSSEVNGITFDYKGIKRSGLYVAAPLQGSSYGYYDLTSSLVEVFAENRQAGNYYVITDGGYKIRARKVVTTTCVLEFEVSFIEGLNGVESVNGTLSSGITSWKASPLNVNSPSLVHPSATATAIV